MMRWIIFSAVMLAGVTAPAFAGGAANAGPPLGGAENVALDELTPVAIPEPSSLAVRYYQTGNWIWAFDQLWVIAVPALLLFSGFSARLQQFAEKKGRYWFFTVAVYVVLYLAIVFLIDLPLNYLQGYVRQHSFGMSNQSLVRWLGNSFKRLGVTLAIAPLIAWIPFYLIRRSPRRWWLYTTLLTVPFGFFAMFVSPIWIDPLFNQYGTLRDRVLEQKILAQAESAGIGGSRIFEVNKSADTRALNAYVKGVFGTKRIVLYDTLLDRLNEREVLAVLGHEMGHYTLGHVHRSMLLSTILIVASLFWVDRAGRWLIARYHTRFGFHNLGSIASVPLVLLLLNVSALAFSPVVCAYSRYQEHEADRFALELTRMNRSAGTAFVKLQEDNLSNPRPGLFYTLLRATHPSIGDRIDFCNAYHPWTKGEPLVYGALFRQ